MCDALGERHAREGNGDEGEELKALFARHAEIDFDTDRQQMVRAMKDVAEAYPAGTAAKAAAQEARHDDRQAAAPCRKKASALHTERNPMRSSATSRRR
ncbi:hypothetical protein ASD34_26585 [Variovorax sp. Root473]|nr:hypothetical protein ASD34_26585 [Variovorax sp. Root473]